MKKFHCTWNHIISMESTFEAESIEDARDEINSDPVGGERLDSTAENIEIEEV